MSKVNMWYWTPKFNNSNREETYFCTSPIFEQLIFIILLLTNYTILIKFIIENSWVFWSLFTFFYSISIMLKNYKSFFPFVSFYTIHIPVNIFVRQFWKRNIKVNIQIYLFIELLKHFISMKFTLEGDRIRMLYLHLAPVFRFICILLRLMQT